MTSILIAGYYGLNNIGDEAILSGMISSLNKYIDDAQFSVITNDPVGTKKIHNVIPIKQSFKEGIPRFALNCIFNSELFDILRQINRCDIFILGGGSLLQDLRIHYLPILLSMVHYAQKKGKKTVVYGIGAGPIDTRLGKVLCRKILGAADLVTVRDFMSKKVLERCGLQNVIQTADPAFGLDLPENDSFFRSHKASEVYPEENFLSATLYNWLQDSDKYHNRASSTEALEKRRMIISKIFSDIYKTHKRKLLFIPTVKVDEIGYSHIKNSIHTSNNVSITNYTNDLFQVLSLLSKSDLLIGMRLHSLIFASIIGIPIVPISYCGKVKSYLELVGLEDLYLDINDLSNKSFRDKLLENIAIVESDAGYYSTLLREASRKLREKSAYNAKLCSELI